MSSGFGSFGHAPWGSRGPFGLLFLEFGTGCQSAVSATLRLHRRMDHSSKVRATACLSDWLCPLEELTTTEFYNDFLLRYGIVHGMFGLLQRDKTSWASVSLYKSSLSGEFRLSDLDTLNFLLPHIQRAFRLHFQFSQLRGRSEGIEAALNKLTTGVIVLGAKGEVLVMNNRAEQVLNRRNGLLLNHGRLEAAVYAESTCLRAMIGEASKTGSGTGRSPGGTILISR